MQESLKELIEQAILELNCAQSYFDNCDPEHFNEALANLNNKQNKLNLLYKAAKLS